MAFGRISNKTLPTHKIEEEKPSSIELRELINLDKAEERLGGTSSKIFDTVKTLGKGTRAVQKGFLDWHLKGGVGAVKGLEVGIQVGKDVFKRFWGGVVQDIDKSIPKYTATMSEFHFNMLKRGMTEDEQAYYKFLSASDEQLEGDYDNYVRLSVEEAKNRHEEFTNGIDEYVTGKKEDIKKGDERAQEIMDEYGISGMIGYGMGQMFGNYNELASNVMATYFGTKVGTGTSLVGMDDLFNITENVMSNTVSENLIADAKDEDIDLMNVATRTALGTVFLKGVGELVKKQKVGKLTKLEAKKLKESQAIMSEDFIKQRTMEDAVDRGITPSEDVGFKLVYPNDQSKVFTEENGSELYKSYKMKKITEEFAWGKGGEGMKNEEKLLTTRARQEAEIELKELMRQKFGDDYKFEKYVNDMDSAYSKSTFDQYGVEEKMEVPNEVYKDKGSNVDAEVEATSLIENQDISTLQRMSTEFEDAQDILSKSDAEMRAWYDSNC